MNKVYCPSCERNLVDSEIIDWDDDLPIYECQCGCIFNVYGEDLTEDYED